MQLTIVRICVLALLSLSLPLAAGAVPPQPMRVINVRSKAGPPQTDGQFVIWAEPEASTGETTRAIYAVALDDGRRVTVAAGLPGQPPFENVAGDYAIDNGVVVWVEGTQMAGTIRTRSLVTGQAVTVAAGAVAYPAIAGSIVTWWEDVDERRAQRPDPLPATLKARDISTMAEPVVVTQTPNTIYVRHFGPSKIRNGWVVWSKPTAHGYTGLFSELRAVPLQGGAQRLLGQTWTAGQLKFDFNGDRVVYLEVTGSGRPESFQAGPVFLVDPRSGERTGTGAHGFVSGLTADGRYLFWTKSRQAGQTVDVDLWGYDPRTDSAFIVAEGAELAAAHARNGMLVWLWQDAQSIAIHAAPIPDVLPTGGRRAPASPGAGQAYFVETRHFLAGGFKTYWERSGGLPVFGYPLTEEFIEKNADSQEGRPAQYFERQRFELHPENAGTPYEVLLGRLGVDLLRAQGRDWQSFPKADPTLPHYFPQTGHAIAGEFWDYWRSHGLEFGDRNVSLREALALFGYPISEPQLETNSSGDRVLTQWFERARLEFHPDKPEPYKVLLGRLAYELLQQRSW